MPETAWTEFWTTARIVEELREIGVDDLFIGQEAMEADLRMSVPEDTQLTSALDRAREAGADPELLESMRGGYTGCVAVLDCGPGPTIALRVDIDGLPQQEADTSEHLPADEGFRSEHGGQMHACGHDAHATFGIGVLETIKQSEFNGTLKVLFQPAEEVVGGGRAMAESGHIDDVDHLLAAHVGLDFPTGEIVAGIDGFLAVTQLRVDFEGHPGHAGARPERGYNAVQAMATAVQNLHAIPRHSEGATRINAGHVGGGTATNIVPEHSFIGMELRGETTELRDHMLDRAADVLEGAAKSHGCEVNWEVVGDAPSATSDEALVDVIGDIAADVRGVESVRRRGDIGGSEDATFLMEYVQENGGTAAYVGIGTNHPGGHHTATFDVDEDSLEIGVDTLAGTILQLSQPT
jgi:aminobenzoyl-glutamate utilization protein A